MEIQLLAFGAGIGNDSIEGVGHVLAHILVPAMGIGVNTRNLTNGSACHADGLREATHFSFIERAQLVCWTKRWSIPTLKVLISGSSFTT